MEKQKKILSILHIIIPVYFLVCALYMLSRQSMPYMLLLSMSSTIARFIPIPVKFSMVIPLGFMLLSLFGIYSTPRPIPPPGTAPGNCTLWRIRQGSEVNLYYQLLYLFLAVKNFFYSP